MLSRPGEPNIVWGSITIYFYDAKKVILAFDLEKIGQVEKIKFDLDETQVWGVDHEIYMVDSTHNDLYDDII